MEKALAKEYGLTHSQSRYACRVIFQTIKAMLLEQGILSLPHIGTFYIDRGKPKEIRIPKAMAPVVVSTKCRIRFIPIQELLDGIHKAKPKLGPKFQLGVSRVMMRSPSKESQARLAEAQDD